MQLQIRYQFLNNTVLTRFGFIILTTAASVRFDKKTGKFEEYRPGPEKEKVLKGFILDIALSNDGNIWLSTLFGLTNFNIKTKEFEIYNKSDGLTESELVTIILDNKNQIWVLWIPLLISL